MIIQENIIRNMREPRQNFSNMYIEMEMIKLTLQF